MARFMLIYKGEATELAEMTEEEAAEVMAKWGVWIEGVGPALVDVGAPFSPGQSIVDDGSSGAAVGLTGYSVVEAGTLVEAGALTAGHPYLSEGKGNYSIEVFELMPVPFEA